MIRLPRTGNWKSLVSANNDQIVPVTLNDTDIERLIVRILERLVKRGRVSSPIFSDEQNGLSQIIARLATDGQLSGFEDLAGQEMLRGWFKASVVSVITVGKQKKGEQIDYFIPLTAAVYRSGYPRQTGRHRKADLYAYHSMLASGHSDLDLQALITGSDAQSKSTLGETVDFGMFPLSSPKYKKDAFVDAEALLQLRALETIVGRDATSSETSKDFSPVEEHFKNLGEDLVYFLRAFRGESSSFIVSGMEALLSFHLYQLPLTTSMVLSRAMAGSALEFQARDLEMYVDFTGVSAGHSSQISNSCVARDFIRQRSLFQNMITLRESDSSIRYSEKNNDYKILSSRERLLYQVKALEDQHIQDVARVRLGLLLSELDAESRQILEEEIKNIDNPIKQIAELVILDRQNDGLNGMRKWAYSTGGLQNGMPPKNNALLVGTMSAPSTWRYFLSDSMLITLVRMCFVMEGNPEEASTPKSMPLSKLLNILESRYGVLVSKPPSSFTSAEDFAAAALNIEAFKSRLKTLGFFEGLSDDLRAQFVPNPTTSKESR